MRFSVPCEFPAGYEGSAVLQRLAQVLDPELDESILDLGFVRALELHSGHARVALQLPTSWCAVNFAYLMAEDVRRALLSVDGIHRVTVSLGDHLCGGRDRDSCQRRATFCRSLSRHGRGELGGAPPHLPAQGVFHPSGAAAARAA